MKLWDKVSQNNPYLCIYEIIKNEGNWINYAYIL